MTVQESEKRVSFLQYLNSAMIGVITIVAVWTAATVHEVSSKQEISITEQAVIERVQEIVVKDVTQLKIDISDLKSDNILYIQGWVEQNYVRKQQK